MYIRVKWAEAGFSPETASFTVLQTAAERYELAEEIKKGEKQVTSLSYQDKQTYRSRKLRSFRNYWDRKAPSEASKTTPIPARTSATGHHSGAAAEPNSTVSNGGDNNPR